MDQFIDNESSKLEVKYGLPAKVRFCVRCNMSNQQPMSCNEYKQTSDSLKRTMEFDAQGVCHACRFNDLKWDGTIDWEERERALIELCDRFRRNDGSFDCIVPGSGGKDSGYAAHILKYKYKMNPLTVTWSPHLYTEIGWKNFQSWIHVGGFDNILYTPNGKIHRLLTRNATLNLLHPFQPFILGQKSIAAKMALKFGIPLIFYGEMVGEYGEKVSHKNSKWGEKTHENESDYYGADQYGGVQVRDMLLGGVPVGEYLDQGVPMADLMSYMPLSQEQIENKGIEIHQLGYYLRWVPQKAYYYSFENTGFRTNTERVEGTYQKYASLDDKIDGFFYYTRYIKFGVGRAMMDSAQEVRNGQINKEEGMALIKRYDGEYPQKYEQDFLEYVSMEKQEFHDLCDKFRSPHLWQSVGGNWSLRHNPWDEEHLLEAEKFRNSIKSKEHLRTEISINT